MQSAGAGGIPDEVALLLEQAAAEHEAAGRHRLATSHGRAAARVRTLPDA